MTTTSLKETPLARWHTEAGGRMVDFAGWNMPVQYKSIVTEHMATRTAVGLFDVSHMGEFIVEGAKAFDFLQHMVPNDVSRLSEPNRALYTQMVREDGGTVDDLIIYRRTNDYLVIVNASNIDKDWQWLNQHAGQFEGVKLKNISDATGLIAVQGPKAVDLFAAVVGDWVRNIGSFRAGEATVDGVKIEFGRTGYTGEDGFEVIVAADKTEWLWKLLLHKGAVFGIEPCGLGARDTLRLEAGLPLYGHELTDDISPIEAGLGWSVKLKKDNFLGLSALKKQHEQGSQQQVVCLKAEGKALPRQDYKVYKGSKLVGKVTSGSQGIFVGYPIAFALVESESAKIDTELAIEIRDKHVPARVVSRPWYKRK